MIGRGAIAESADLLERPSRSQRGEPVWEVAYCYPRQGDWSEADFLEFETTNFPAELVDGCLEFLPMPTRTHQRLLRYLIGLLQSAVKLNSVGEVLFAPCPIRLATGHLREPDLFVAKPSDSDEPPTASDVFWVLEIVSPGQPNRDRDLIDKRRDYAKARIPEYWIVDPAEETVTVLSLDAEAYRVHAQFQRGSIATSPLLPEFQINVAELFDAAQRST